MRLEIHSDEREVLLRDLEEFVERFGKSYGGTGRTWDPYDPGNPHGIAIIVSARDDLSGEAPWHLEAPRRDLELLITHLRAGASGALRIGGKAPPVTWLQSGNAADPEGADWHLDIMRVCDTLLERLLASLGE